MANASEEGCEEAMAPTVAQTRENVCKRPLWLIVSRSDRDHQPSYLRGCKSFGYPPRPSNDDCLRPPSLSSLTLQVAHLRRLLRCRNDDVDFLVPVSNAHGLISSFTISSLQRVYQIFRGKSAIEISSTKYAFRHNGV